MTTSAYYWCLKNKKVVSHNRINKQYNIGKIRNNKKKVIQRAAIFSQVS